MILGDKELPAFDDKLRTNCVEYKFSLKKGGILYVFWGFNFNDFSDYCLINC